MGGSSPDAGHCTTSFGAANQLLDSFDDGTLDGWGFDGVVESIGWVGSIGHTCPGAVQLSIPGVAGTTAGLTKILSNANWTKFSKLHLWAKVQTTSYPAGSYLDFVVQANNFADQVEKSQQLAGSVFTDGAFHELVLDLTTFPSAQDLTNVNLIVLSLGLPGNVDGGSQMPVTLSIDDVWLEASAVSDAAATD